MATDVCGQGVIVGRFGMGCGQPFERPEDIYRCYDCSVAFHRDCLIRHCKEKTVLERVKEKANDDLRRLPEM